MEKSRSPGFKRLAEGGMRGLSSSLVRRGGSRTFSGPGAGLGVGAGRGLCSTELDSANDRAHCTTYKSVRPINTTKSLHIHLSTQCL